MSTPPESTPAAAGAGAADVIDHLAGIAPDSPLARLRAARPEVMRAARGSHEALLTPADPAGVSLQERAMIALRVAVLTPSAAATAWYRERLRGLGASDAAVAAVERFPDGPALPAREAAILRHTDRLTTAPRAATPAHLAELKAAGLGPADIVTIAQLIAFVSFQVRAVAALRALAEEA